jgi:lipopolysaccharide export system protein LptA
MNRFRRLLPSLLLVLLAAPSWLSAADKKKPDAAVPTIITSTSMEMWSTDTETRSIFKENVTVTGNNLRITCDKLDVTAVRMIGKDAQAEKNATLPSVEKFKTLVATGNVHIVQGEREVTCGRAEVFPGEDRVVLTEKPVVIDNDGPYVATGDRIVLLRGERRIFGDNIRLQGPPIRDLGFEKDKPMQAPASLPRPTGTP